MTRKDFELIAGVLRENALYDYSPAELAEAFANALQRTNPRFDRERFIAATSGERTGR